jgi:hypothetical protein
MVSYGSYGGDDKFEYGMPDGIMFTRMHGNMREEGIHVHGVWVRVSMGHDYVMSWGYGLGWDGMGWDTFMGMGLGGHW